MLLELVLGWVHPWAGLVVLDMTDFLDFVILVIIK